MKDMVEFIVKQFVSKPDAVEVNEETQDGFVNITLKVAPEDMGLTIGKSGQTIKAIRRLLTVKAIADDVRVNLELIDSGVKPEVNQDNENNAERSEDKKTEDSDSDDKAQETESADKSDQSEESVSPDDSESSEKAGS